jgi:hypothetical protein
MAKKFQKTIDIHAQWVYNIITEGKESWTATNPLD